MMITLQLFYHQTTALELSLSSKMKTAPVVPKSNHSTFLQPCALIYWHIKLPLNKQQQRIVARGRHSRYEYIIPFRLL